MLQTLAVMPAYTLAALRGLAGRCRSSSGPLHRQRAAAGGLRPLGDHERGRDRRHADAHEHARALGAPVRARRRPRRRRGDARLPSRTLSAPRRSATRLRRSRIGRVGPVFQGYDCVDADDDRLRAATGIEAVRIEAAELRELYLAVDPARVGELERETRELYEVEPSAEGDVLARSLRAACALDDLVERHRLDAGAINCHVPEIRFGEEIGIAPCFALGRQTSRGIPWACAGDIVTAVAMLTLKLLGAAAQYHELESLDYATGELVDRELRRARSRVRGRAAAAGEEPLVRRGSALRRLRVLRRARRPGDARGLHRARRARARLSLHRRARASSPARAGPGSARRMRRSASAAAPRSRPGRAGAARAPTTTRRRRRATSPARSRASRGSSASRRCGSKRL